MVEETTTEQLAEIDRDMADIERQVAELVEEAQQPDYPQPQPVQVREGRWRTRGGDIRDVIPTPNYDERATKYPWYDAKYDQAWQNNGRYFLDEENHRDLVEYLGPIEPDKTQELPEYTPPEGWRVVRFGEQLQPGDMWVNEDGTEQRSAILHWDAAAVSGGRCIRRIKPEPEPESDTELQAQVAFLKGREVTLGTRLQQEKEVTTRLRGDLELVQKLLGTEKQRVTQLEDLVSSLRTINRGCENAVREAGNMNTALRNQLAAVASVAADRQRLLIELDAAQQVPADSPELRQLRADLAEVTQDRDTYRDGYDRVLSDLRTIRETAKAEAVEAIAEWLEPIRLADSAYLANATMQHLPSIMRHLTGLDSHAID